MSLPILRCEDCGAEVPESDSRVQCPCGGLLNAVIPNPNCSGALLREHLDRAEEPSGVWRFGQLIHPGIGRREQITHPEGNTPLLQRESLSHWAGVEDLSCKHEGHNPTGSFKDRGMTVAVTQAKRTGASALACASTGNTSASLASYGAQAGLPVLVLIPKGQIALGKLTQSLAFGARTLIVDGDFDACLRLAREATEALGVQLLNSVNPWRIEGQKSIALELLRQLAWSPPDWIVLPAGNLGNTAALGKALQEALQWGLIDRLPRLASIQASGAAPFYQSWLREFDGLTAVKAETVATAIRIGNPASWKRAVAAIRSTNGVVAAVSDREILAAKAAIDASGIGCEPASAASLAGIRQLRHSGVIKPGDSVVAILTGHLLKDPGILQQMHQDGTSPWANPPREIPATVAALSQQIPKM